MNQDFSRPSTRLSTTRRHIAGTPLPSAGSVAYKGSGELENTFRSAARSYFNPCKAETRGLPISLLAISRGRVQRRLS